MSETRPPGLGEFRLLVSGPEHPGLSAAVSGALAEQGADVVRFDQLTPAAPAPADHAGPTSYLRAAFRVEEPGTGVPLVEQALHELLDGKGMTWTISDASAPKRMIILASRSDHCLLELLWRHRRGELAAEIPLVISNHRDVQAGVEFFGIPFVHVPSGGEDKSASEAEILELVRGRADLVVLARYMQVLSEDFLRAIGAPVINIHHSFLPAFVGAGPYRKAWERGVKLIGATAHYVTPELDAGPIIEQDVARVDHTYGPKDLQKRGAYVERAVLSRAVQAHLEDRVVSRDGRTVVFE
ncbi:formyltetrahydrofolate deformylase [Brachybacterium kimchii]|uniref:Formyltetrahydrofolate deformylase n=1 Tax=Brachybacterium kimchii TaxID=2942909 RepID=A0ABY4N8K9_9MICO|nr:formyltetrahydrofolate deformylase [Brachybacterium kimchii]UQN30436.1 formyltetrahydrofolate deformylase [Brachybacterium kimchii]